MSSSKPTLHPFGFRGLALSLLTLPLTLGGCAGQAPATECEATEYQSTDEREMRVCRPLTECGLDEFESVAPTMGSDRECTATARCRDNEYETTAPTPNSDRACASLTACRADEYETTAPTSTSDRACASRTLCNAGERLSVAGGPAEDDVCTACEPGRYCPGGTEPPEVCGWDDRDFDASTPCARVVDVEIGSPGNFPYMVARNSGGELYLWGGGRLRYELESEPHSASNMRDVVDAVAGHVPNSGGSSWGGVCWEHASGEIECLTKENRTNNFLPAGVVTLADEGTNCGLDADGAIVFTAECADPRPTPVFSNPIASLRCNRELVCATDTEGNFKCGGCGAQPAIDEPVLAQSFDLDYSAGVCIVDPENHLRCWGTWPAYTPAPDTMAKQVCVASIHICTIDMNDRLRCWPDDSSYYHDPPFLDSDELGDVVDVACTNGMVMTLGADGSVSMWGDDGVRERDNFRSHRPKVHLSAGYDQFCMVDTIGYIECAGNTHASSYINAVQDLWSPSRFDPGRTVYASRFLSADLCIRYSSGEVICYEGTINRSITTIDYGSSHAMGNFDDFTHGTTHQCGVKDGAVTCFDGYGAPSSAAATVPTGLGRIVDIESFVGSTCALDDEGNVTCWGSLAAPAMPPIRELVSGGLGSYCAIDVNGGLHCWGGVSTVPEGLDRVEHVAVSNSFACAVRETREIVCWGNSAATIIDNAPAYSPVGVVDIALTGGHLSTACILDEAGRVGCWGHPAMLGTAIDLN